MSNRGAVQQKTLNTCMKPPRISKGALKVEARNILGDPWADSGGEGKSKRAGKCSTKKSKERREEPLGTMSYRTSSKRSPPFWLLIGARKLVFFWHQSEARKAATVWNWSGKTMSPGALLAVLYFSSFHISLAPFICPWVSEDEPGNDKANISRPCNLTPWSFIVSRHQRWPVVVLHIFIFLILKLS